MVLQMAFKAINDTARPNGLVLTLLVYGALPRMVEYDVPSLTVTQLLDTNTIQLDVEEWVERE
jgi:hypothetical protein